MNDAAPIVRVLGSRVHMVSVDTAADRMVEYVRCKDGRCRQVVVTGFHGLWEAHKNPELHRVLNAADLWVPDGIAPVWVARLRGHRGVQRVPGAELMDAFFARADKAGFSGFFYGDSDSTLAALRTALVQKYPGHRIAGTFSPPFRPLSDDEEAEHVRMINESGADVLWLGLGLPKQDLWIGRNLHRLRVPLAVGVGAAFRFLAGTVERAPGWVGRMGLEWLWRLAREPGKCWRRCVVDGPCFVWCVSLELTGLRKYDRSP
jgi:N-acetylglucosaminyldiphosphoundecaprenol N-acetyl-beta-D-mannosaminyltransferase